MRSGIPIVVLMIIVAVSVDTEGGESIGAGTWSDESVEGSSRRFAVEFTERLEFRSLNEDLARTCRASGRVRGCTEFPSEALDCECYRDGAGWRLAIRARIAAVMHVDHPGIVLHERRHLRHLNDLLSAYLEKMTAPRFATASRCRSLARILSRPHYVTAMMNELRMRSNDHFQCSRPGGNEHPEGLLAFRETETTGMSGPAR